MALLERTPRVPIYSISSCVSLFSLEAAFFIDLVRDLYVRARVDALHLSSLQL
jgi:hypothetical protein